MNKTIEKVLVILYLFFSTGAVLGLLFDDASADHRSGDVRGQIAWGVLYLALSPYCIRAFPRIWKAALRNKLPLAVVVFALISVLWSQQADLTVRRAAALIATTLVGLYFGTRFSIREQLKLLSIALALAVVLSLLTVIFLPSVGVMDAGAYAGTWRGVFILKNALGRTMVLAAIVFLFMFYELRYRVVRLCFACLMVLAVFLIWMSASDTALVALFLCLAAFVAFRVLRYRLTRVVPILSVVLLITSTVTMALYANSDVFFRLLGRDSTLTGRTVLWKFVAIEIAKRPLLGAGYSAFWDKYGVGIRANVGWDTPHSHNGILDLALDLGLVGVGFFLVAFVRAFLKNVRLLRTSELSFMWPLLFLSYMAIYNLTESTILVGNGIFWMLYITSAVTPYVFDREGRRRSLDFAGNPQYTMQAIPCES